MNGIENADFESAISATGYGKFNILLACATFPSVMAIIFDTASIAFVIPSGAECYLGLSNTNKGLMIAAIYFGMVCSSVPWSYFADTSGRKHVIAYGLITDAIIVIISGTTQHWMFLTTCRFLSGLCICGPFATIYTYLAEVNCNKRRQRSILFVGVYLSIGGLLLPLVAMLVIPPSWEIDIAGYKYHSWHFYLMLCAVPGLFGGICFLFFPESPKYLMTQGKNDQAMKNFKLIYKLNNGTKTPYPIKTLAEEKLVFHEKEKGVALTKAQKAKQQFIDVIFSREYFWKMVMVFCFAFCAMMCQNTVRLWVPQIFKLSKDLEITNELDQSLCAVFAHAKNKSHAISKGPKSCKNTISVEAYIPNLYNSVVNIVAFLIVIVFVNKIGVKLLLAINMGLSAIFAASLYFAEDGIDIIALITVYLTFVNIASTNVITASTSLFPTQIRATIVIASLLLGRIGSMVGSAVFPVLMHWGCLETIAFITMSSVVAFVISVFIPSPPRDSLK